MKPLPIEIEIEVLSHYGDLELPCYQTEGAAGFDFRAAVEEPMTIEPGERVLVPSGLKMAVPAGYELQVRPRSGLAVKHGITVLNSPGTVDSDYRGEICIALINLGRESLTVERGMRIAQGVVAPCVQGNFRAVAALDDTARSGGGFGHTGNT